jgi:hypothetical protein
VNWDNKAIYVTNQETAQLAMGSIELGCKLTYRTIISDGVFGLDAPAEIAQAKSAHGYVVTGDFVGTGAPGRVRAAAQQLQRNTLPGLPGASCEGRR